MNQTEKEYRNTMLRIGSAMLLFVALFYLLNTLLAGVSFITDRFLSEKSATILNQLLYDAAYLFSFLFPAGFFYMISKKNRTERVMADVRLGGSFSLMLPAGLAVVLAAAYVNSYIMEIFHYSEYSEEVFSEPALGENYLVLLAFVGTAVIPAFCEEFLFRGVVLTNLLPYGKTTAIIASAALFALMHQNGGQLFYTFVAGVVTGLIYVRTRSIWGGILFHFINNLLSVVEQLIYSRLDAGAATAVCTYIEAATFALGIVSALLLIILERKKKKRGFTASGFGVIFEPDEDYVEKPLAEGRAARLFFSPTVIVFTCISGVMMALLILLAAAT